jgi:hypothetical protein
VANFVGRLTLLSWFIASLTLSGCTLSAQPGPIDLILMRAAGPTVFGATESNRYPRLFSVEPTDANAALSGCRRNDWVQTGERVQPDFTTGSGRTLDFACRTDKTIILAEVLIDPWQGMDGVVFAACRPKDCPSPETAFRHGFRE